MLPSQLVAPPLLPAFGMAAEAFGQASKTGTLALCQEVPKVESEAVWQADRWWRAGARERAAG